jgi:hypothetical protein
VEATGAERSAEGSYIRGGAASADPRLVLRIVGGLVGLGLVIATVLLTLSAVHSNDARGRLRRLGVPVQAVVSGCQAITSGIGMGVEYYDCRGSFQMGGRSYDELINGSRADLPTGQSVPALVVPGDAASLTLASHVSRAGSSFGPYIAPLCTGVAAVLIGGWLAWGPTGRKGPGDPPDSGLPDSVAQGGRV